MVLGVGLVTCAVVVGRVGWRWYWCFVGCPSAMKKGSTLAPAGFFFFYSYLVLSGLYVVPLYSNIVLNIQENVGIHTLYEPRYKDILLPFVLSFSFVKTIDSTRGPILDALEIGRYVQRASKTSSQDVVALVALIVMSPMSDWANEGGDPCLPVQWYWAKCSLDSPPRVTKVGLSVCVTRWVVCVTRHIVHNKTSHGILFLVTWPWSRL